MFGALALNAFFNDSQRMTVDIQQVEAAAEGGF